MSTDRNLVLPRLEDKNMLSVQFETARLIRVCKNNKIQNIIEMIMSESWAAI
jgi:hypothetical protein